MKQFSRLILVAIMMLTCGAAAFKKPALLSGTVMGLIALWRKTDQQEEKSTSTVHRPPTCESRPSSEVSTISFSGSANEASYKPIKAMHEPTNFRHGLTKVYAYIDEPNILSSAYVSNLLIHYESLVPALRKQGYSIEKATIYVMEKPESSGYQFFLNRMKNTDFEVIERNARTIGDDIIRKDIDTWLATDIALGASDVDTVVLVTGDNDFSYTVARLQEKNKKVVVVGVEANTSQELREQADHWLNITHLDGVCERKVRPPKLRKSHVDDSKPRYTKPIKLKTKPVIKRPVKVVESNRTTA